MSLDTTYMQKGAVEMTARLRAAARRVPGAIERGMYRFGNIEIKEMQRRTPVDFGILIGSAFVERPLRQGEVFIMWMGFGGAAEEYAIYVHEDLEALHPVGQAKFVESVLNESGPYFAQRVAVDVQAELALILSGMSDYT